MSHTRKIMTNLLSSATNSSSSTDPLRDLAAAKRYPYCDDSLLCTAIIGAQRSLKFEETGSWFVQALTEALDESAAKSDMLTVLTRVNCKIKV